MSSTPLSQRPQAGPAGMGAVVRALITLALVLLTAFLGVALAAADTAHALGAPRPLSPRNSEKVQQLPAITWSAVRGAAAYEYEISSNPRFTALVGSGPGRQGTQTHNLAAVLEKEVSDGTFYWRVRALGRKNQGGRWSRMRKIVKRWSAKPALTGGDGVVVNWPSSPLVLRWSSVPYAFKYLVTIATDPGLSNVVLGTKTKPVTTQALSPAPAWCVWGDSSVRPVRALQVRWYAGVRHEASPYGRPVPPRSRSWRRQWPRAAAGRGSRGVRESGRAAWASGSIGGA